MGQGKFAGHTPTFYPLCNSTNYNAYHKIYRTHYFQQITLYIVSITQVKMLLEMSITCYNN